MYDTSWTERVGWTMIMNHLPSNSTSNMRPRASFGLGLFFLISSTDLSAESIHNKTFNRILPRWIQLHQDSNFKTHESWTKTIKPLREQIKHFNQITTHISHHITHCLSTEQHSLKRKMPCCEMQTRAEIIETVSVGRIVGIQTDQNCHASMILTLL